MRYNLAGQLRWALPFHQYNLPCTWDKICTIGQILSDLAIIVFVFETNRLRIHISLIWGKAIDEEETPYSLVLSEQ